MCFTLNTCPDPPDVNAVKRNVFRMRSLIFMYILLGRETSSAKKGSSHRLLFTHFPPCFLPLFCLCSCSLSCCVAVVFDSSFYLSLLGGKTRDKKGEMGNMQGEDRWALGCINSSLLTARLLLIITTNTQRCYFSPHPCHLPPFIRFFKVIHCLCCNT